MSANNARRALPLISNFTFPISRRGFTLAELLAVIAIMAIMLGLTFVGFNQLGASKGVAAAIAELKTTLSLARQWAITHRQETCVVFAPEISSDLTKAYRAYAVFAITNKTLQTGHYVRDWTFLPQGVVFVRDATPGNVFEPIREKSIPFPQDSSVGQTLPVISFSPDGGVLGAGINTYQIYVREGWAMVSTNGSTLDYGVNPGKSNRSVQVFTLTGGLKVKDYSQ
ncbi:MAG: prepilin-type N-terminal cleavage/methylation domain-containing protein [Kiritimatiellae bacterium]|nr:prepilin-type N-terminal cleavage/methylation domain-containing protein [Kiritimatiellia bacterium]